MISLSRRRFLAASAAGTGALLSSSLGARLAFAAPGDPAGGDVVVLFFLRGGADGLQIAPPYVDPSYYSLRPKNSIPPPNEPGGALPLTSASSPNVVFPSGMDGVMGLHPGMAPIYDTLWKQGNLAVIPATGMPEWEKTTRSHFQNARLVERGTNDVRAPGSFMGRLVTAVNPTGNVGSANWGGDLINGSLNTVNIGSIPKFKLDGYSKGDTPHAVELIRKMYTHDNSISTAAINSLSALEEVAGVKVGVGKDPYTGKNLKHGQPFMEIAGMINANLGLKAAALNMGGWDSHGRLDAINGRINKVALQLRAFADATNQLEGITVIVLTEFGRNIAENGGNGTDHGKAGTHLIMGKGIQGGVFGDDFPTSLAEGASRGALPVLTDYRKAIREVAVNRAGVADPTPIFPSLTDSGSLGITRA